MSFVKILPLKDFLHHRYIRSKGTYITEVSSTTSSIMISYHPIVMDLTLYSSIKPVGKAARDKGFQPKSS